MLGLSVAIMAITDWLELHSKPHIRVLVVEDNPEDQELLQLQLRKSQLHENVIFMSDADQALELLQGYRKGEFEWELIAIFLDIHLPGMSGIELLQFLRSVLGMDDLHVIMMTSSNDPQEIEECHKLKVAGFIQKPVTFSSFSNSVANIFHKPPPARSFLGRVE
jgi:CheY-like chemotaxis protein